MLLASGLEKKASIGYTDLAVDSQQVSSKIDTSAKPIDSRQFSFRARNEVGSSLSKISLRHVSLREIGWSRNPTS